MVECVSRRGTSQTQQVQMSHALYTTHTTWWSVPLSAGREPGREPAKHVTLSIHYSHHLVESVSTWGTSQTQQVQISHAPYTTHTTWWRVLARGEPAKTAGTDVTLSIHYSHHVVESVSHGEPAKHSRNRHHTLHTLLTPPGGVCHC